MTRSRLALLLLLATVTVGCEKSSAVPNSPKPAGEVTPRFTALKVVASEPSEPAKPTIPPVVLSTMHAKWCVSKVSDPFPAIELPRLGGPSTKLSTLYGKQATVVLFWTSDRWMSRMALEDLVHEVATVYEPKQVAVVGIAVSQTTSAMRKRLGEANAEFPQLLDADGSALAEVGSVALPRIYVLDPAGKIVWFDIEYSESTRRELERTLSVLTANSQ
jgi:thioredoxin-dependent peroxiredoxin